MYYGMICPTIWVTMKRSRNVRRKRESVEKSPTRLFVLLRIAQCYFELGKQQKAQKHSPSRTPHPQYGLELASVGFRLVQIMVNNEEDDFDHLNKALQMADSIDQMGVDRHISQQYRMAAASHASSVHRKLAIVYGTMEEQSDETREKRAHHLQKSLEKSELSVSIYEQFGYTSAVEITGEWVLYRMGQAFIANGRRPEALPFIRRAYDEMMRKQNLIPEGSSYRQTFIENIVHHRQIMSAYRLLNF